MIENICIKPITNLKEAKAFVKLLFSIDKVFHFEDDAKCIINIKTNMPLFTKQTAILVNKRLEEAYNIDFEEFTCPIDYAMYLENTKDIL